MSRDPLCNARAFVQASRRLYTKSESSFSSGLRGGPQGGTARRTRAKTDSGGWDSGGEDGEAVAVAEGTKAARNKSS